VAVCSYHIVDLNKMALPKNHSRNCDFPSLGEFPTETRIFHLTQFLGTAKFGTS